MVLIAFTGDEPSLSTVDPAALLFSVPLASNSWFLQDLQFNKSSLKLLLNHEQVIFNAWVIKLWLIHITSIHSRNVKDMFSSQKACSFSENNR